MKSRGLLTLTLSLIASFTFGQEVTSESLSNASFKGMSWRNIGPFRGGRSVASTGVLKQAHTYFMGSTGGGIWKTTDDGLNWKNISDGFLKTGTVGAIAVSESDPNVVYVGMGEHPARGVMTSMGDGMYKSMDAGQSWSHIGLDYSRHISDVIIHPSNPDVVYVAVQGAQYGDSEDRGIYKSRDGGNSWSKVLYIDERTGASSLTMDMNNPLVLYASMWDHRRYPWKMESGGAGSGLYKSVDGGMNWTKMSTGLPEMMGKSGISVSRANSNRIFAVIEAEGEKGGVYRSDNQGKSWTQTSKDRILITRSWYYMEIFADTQDENTVYVLNAPMLKSIDGGKTFKPVGTPHGDNHHLWIHPDNNSVMINSNDGGANISNNGGMSWSTQSNQPTAQFYRVIADRKMPYYVYGGQQDNSSVAIASRTDDRGIDHKDWFSGPGCESAFIAFDPDNPEILYGGCYQGILERFNVNSSTHKEIKEYPELGLGKYPSTFKYRFNWNAPLLVDPFDASVIYHAGNVVFKSTDKGQSWTVISPDLTRNEKDKHNEGGGPFTNEGAGGENYNTLMSLTASPHEQGVMWAGSDDGLVHLTQDGGKTWNNVTPKGISNYIINSIEVSPHDAATAYIAVMGYKNMDLTPHIFKTTDYGKKWKRITDGIEGEHTFVRVVREDPIRKDLLYAGTETGLFISTDGGAQWNSFQLNLPVVPINDLTIADNDLVAATAGRSFWILDDLGFLQGADDTSVSQLFSPKTTYRIMGGQSRSTTQGTNPLPGAIIDYYLSAADAEKEIRVEVLNKKGDLIRSYISEAPENFKTWPGGPSKPLSLKNTEGFHRFHWDLRHEPLPSLENIFVFGGLSGANAAPGTYTLKLYIGDEMQSTTLDLQADPRVEAPLAAYQSQEAMLTALDQMLTQMHDDVNYVRTVKKELKWAQKRLDEDDELSSEAQDLMDKMVVWEEKIIQPKQKTFQDVINFHNKLGADMIYLKSYIDSDDPEPTQGAQERFDDLSDQWNAIVDEKKNIDEAIAKFNAAYLKSAVQPLSSEE